MNKIKLLLLTLVTVMLSCATISPIITPLNYVGSNLDGGQFGTNYPGTEGIDYSWPTTADVDYLTSKGMKTFRVGFQWERLQPTLMGNFAPAYFNKLDALVKYATGKGANVFLNPHNFAKYKVAGQTESASIGSATVPNEAFADLWKRLAVQYKSNPKVLFSLVNEPNTMPTEQWVAGANSAIMGIRSAGNNNLISVPGNGWTSAAGWTSNWYGTPNSIAMLQIKDPANNYVFEVHNYFDSDNSGSYNTDCKSVTVGSAQLANVTTWARANKKKILVGEFGVGPVGSTAVGNGSSTSATCQSAVKDMLAYIHNNQDVYVGWLWWSAGTPWGKTYKLSISPKNGIEDVRVSWLKPYLDAAGNGTSSTATPPATPAPIPTVQPVASSTFPSNPMTVTKNTVFTTTSSAPTAANPNATQTNWAYVPNSYDSTHSTPTRLFVWLHGCGGQSEWDAHMVSFMPDQSWISLAPGGRETTCWSTIETDGSKILAAIADIRARFNIDPYRIILGGYSSGGDIGYPLLFQNANMFAGGLFENTGPSSAAMTNSTVAAWKINILHLAHTGDTTYPIAGIRTKMTTLKNAGFPLTLIEKPGTHYDSDNGTTGTQYDLRTFVLPQINGGWTAPGAVPPPPPPAACVYTYSSWGDCQTTNTQTRTVIGSTPVPCTPSAQTLNQSCVFVPPSCIYTYSPWGICQSSGTQTRTVTGSSPVPCSASTQTLSQNCTYVPPVVDAGSTLPVFYARGQVYNQGTSWTCMYFYVKNTTDTSKNWSLMYVNAYDSKLTSWWSMKTNQVVGSTGSVKFTPVDVISITAKTETKVGGACFDFGPLKKIPIVSGIN